MVSSPLHIVFFKEFGTSAVNWWQLWTSHKSLIHHFLDTPQSNMSQCNMSLWTSSFFFVNQETLFRSFCAITSNLSSKRMNLMSYASWTKPNPSRFRTCTSHTLWISILSLRICKTLRSLHCIRPAPRVLNQVITIFLKHRLQAKFPNSQLQKSSSHSVPHSDSLWQWN